MNTTYNGQLSSSRAEKFDREVKLSSVDWDLILKWYYSFLDENKDFIKVYEEKYKITIGRINKYYIPGTEVKIKTPLYKADIDNYILWSNSVFMTDWTNDDQVLLDYLTLASTNDHIPKKEDTKAEEPNKI